MGHSSKKHSRHGRSSHGGHHRSHGEGAHDFHGSRGSRPGRAHAGFGFSGDPGGFGGGEHATGPGPGGQGGGFAPHPGQRGFGAGVEADARPASTGDKVARLVLAALALYEAARAFYDDNPRPRAKPAQPAQSAQRPAAGAAVRIAVCGGGSCSRRWDTASPVEEVRQTAAANGQAVIVTTSPCMKMCEQGPVVTVAPGTPREQRFVNVQKRKILGILKAAANRA